MRWPASLAFPFLLVSSINFVFASPLTLSESLTNHTLLHQNDGSTSVEFQISCSNCGDEQRTGLPLGLSVHVANKACDGTSLALNGIELAHSWNEVHGYGSGIIPSYLNDSDGVLAAHWQSTCISSGGLSDEPIRQLLTVWIDRVGEFDPQDNLGFTFLFKQAEPPGILCLCTEPWDLSADGSFPDHLKNSGGIECLEVQSDVSDADKGQPRENREWHWTRLQHLKAKAHRFQQSLREMLIHGCTDFQANWKDCRAFGCKVKVSFMYVSATIRGISYKFGLACSWSSGCSQHVKESTQTPQTEPSTSSSDLPHEDLYSSFPSTLHIPPTSEQVAPIQEPDISPQFSAKDFARTCLVISLVGLIIALVFKICRNTMYCRRRRVDRAARREERRAQLAYRSAARRFKWQQWWKGTTQEPASTPPLDHDLSVIQQPEQILQYETEPNSSAEPGAMQAEIQDFRRTLEYVGELVQQPNGNLEEARPSRKDENPNGAEHLDVRSKTPNTIASSTACLSTVISIGTRSLMSLETTSSMTVDTLETIHTSPPSYHE
ncbi:hypothetical protein BDV28DRAFT_47379 [Aspergillus coremiiformis]|uniref:Uncharacterized protein n=1 Tax=Aspergillus coremiiformis TaxID=138285 RepID=A0A5N6YXD3_9EURO|nr:hypothetical protein BDV28DRAFT_47379 [Aspergillus coremiiformis]